MSKKILKSLFWIVNLYNIAFASTPQVVVTIKPIYALTAGVMEGVNKPYLLLQGTESPHNYNLRPSQVRELYSADLVVWIGPNVEGFLKKIIISLQNKDLPLLGVQDLTLLKIRQHSAWDTHHDDDSTSHDDIDPHIWLNPQNAKFIVQAIANKLSLIDPDNAVRYLNNSNNLIKKLDDFDRTLEQQLNPIKNIPYVVFHDAFQYFERHYGLTVAGSVYVSPDSKLSAKHLAKLRKRMESVRCLFSEPQFKPIPAIVENISVRQGVLDPLGATLPLTSDSYFTLLQNLANSLNECLIY